MVVVVVVVVVEVVVVVVVVVVVLLLLSLSLLLSLWSLTHDARCDSAGNEDLAYVLMLLEYFCLCSFVLILFCLCSFAYALLRLCSLVPCLCFPGFGALGQKKLISVADSLSQDRIPSKVLCRGVIGMFRGLPGFRTGN